MRPGTDLQLLRAYARDGDERAFAEVVARHADWVTRAARRRWRRRLGGDDHGAGDAAQAVVLRRRHRRLLHRIPLTS